MVKSKLSWLARRAVLDNKKSSPEDFQQIAEDMLAAGNLSGATYFFQRANNKEKLQQLLSQAVTDGDFFQYSYIIKFLGTDHHNIDDIKRLKENAELNGFHIYAQKASDLLEQQKIN